MSNRFQYQPRPQETIEQRASQTGSTYISFIKDWVETYSVLKTGNWLRPLPPTWPNASHYGLDIFVHYGVGPLNATVLCNLKLYNEKCRVCEAYQEADSKGNLSDEELYALKATKRVLAWFIDRKEPKEDPVAWAQPWTFDRDVSKLCKDPTTGELYVIDHPEVGYDISFDREDGQKYTGIQIARRSSAVEDKYLEFIMKNPIPSILVKRSYEEVKNLFEGGAGPNTKTQVQVPEQPPQQEQTQPRQTVQTPPQPNVQTTQQPDIPWTPPVQPQQAQTQSFCDASVSFGGQSLGCGLNPNHEGQHAFTRPIATASSAPAQPTQPNGGQVPQQPGAGQGMQASALRARFSGAK